MKFRYLSLGLAASLAILSGCGSVPTQKEFGLYADVPMADADIMPVVSSSKDAIKVIVMNAEDGTDSLAQAAQLGSTLSKSIAHLIGGRGIEIVDDTLAPRLRDEMRKAEAAGNFSYSGPKVANFVIKPVLSKTSYGANYIEASQTQDKKGKVYVTPASYSHSATMAAAVRIYEMPSLRLAATVNISGSDSRSEARAGASTAIGTSMVRAAAENAVNYRNKTELLNFFAPKGFVSTKRVHQKEAKSLFLVTMGRQDGLKTGDEVGVYSVRKGPDILGQKSVANEEVLVMTGKVSENLTDTTAWIAPEDEAAAKRVKRGDLVKLQHSDNFFLKIMK